VNTLLGKQHQFDKSWCMRSAEINGGRQEDETEEAVFALFNDLTARQSAGAYLSLHRPPAS